MADKRYALVKRLRDQTVNGKVEWERTATNGIYQASFPNYSIKISEGRSPQSDESPAIYVRIYNSEGTLIESFNDEDLPTDTGPNAPYAIMSQLFEFARRQAMGVDAALDSIMGALDDEPRDGAPPGPGGPPDDDIPF